MKNYQIKTLLNLMSNPSDQPNNDPSLSDCFQSLQISSDLRRKRDEYIEDIRSRKREARICSRRRIPFDFIISRYAQESAGQKASMEEFIADCQKQTFTLEQLSDLAAFLNSDNLYKQYFGVIGIRLLLVNENPPIQQIIDAGIIPKLIEFLGKEDEQKLQLEAAWALANAAIGTTKQIQEMVDNGVIPALIKLLGSMTKKVQAQAIWTLANIAADNVNFRDTIIKEGAISLLVKIMEEALSKEDVKLTRQGSWLLSNLCQAVPLPLYEEVKESLPIFAKVIMKQTDEEMLRDALWSLKCLVSEDEERIQEIVDTGVVPSLVKLLEHPWLVVYTPCIKIIGSLFKGNTKQVDNLLSIPGMTDQLMNALKHPDRVLQIDAAEILSSITAGTAEHKEAIVGNHGYLSQLFSIGANDPLEVRRDVAQIFNNAITDPPPRQLRVFQFLLEKRVFDYFEKLIEDKDEILQEIALAGIRNILGLEGGEAYEGSTRAFFWSLLEKNKTIGVIEKLQNHAMQVSKLTAEILTFRKTIASEERNGDS